MDAPTPVGNFRLNMTVVATLINVFMLLLTLRGVYNGDAKERDTIAEKTTTALVSMEHRLTTIEQTIVRLERERQEPKRR